MSRRETQLNTFVRQARDLYSLPAVAVEVLALADDSQADATRLKASIERDPALSAKLLRVVNSSLFGLARPVTELGQAIALLGVKSLKLLVLGFCLPERMFAAREADVLRSYWTRTLTRAVACRELSRTVGAGHDDEAFLAGLLGDLGVLVFIQEGGERYAHMYRRAQDDATPLAILERRYYGFDHIDITVRLLTDWKLPASYCAAIEQALSLPRDADASTGVDVVPRELSSAAALLRAADRLATIVVAERTEHWPVLLADVERRWRLPAERLADLAEEVQHKVEMLGQVLHVEVAAEHSYRDVLQRAQRRLPGSSEEVVEELLRLRTIGGAEKQAVAAEQAALDDLSELQTDARQAAEYAAEMRTAARELRELGRMPEAETGGGPASSTKSPTKSAARGKPSAAALVDVATSLEEAIAVCRRTRTPLSLVLVELDRYQELAPKLGPLWAEYAAALLGEVCRSLEAPRLRLVHEAAERWALILPNMDRRRAWNLVDELIERYRALAPLDAVGSTTLSCGTATVNAPPANFPVAELQTAAARCLYAAQQASGDTSKSIELC